LLLAKVLWKQQEDATEALAVLAKREFTLEIALAMQKI
jgi:hypothetical protein